MRTAILSTLIFLISLGAWISDPAPVIAGDRCTNVKIRINPTKKDKWNYPEYRVEKVCKKKTRSHSSIDTGKLKKIAKDTKHTYDRAKVTYDNIKTLVTEVRKAKGGGGPTTGKTGTGVGCGKGSEAEC